MYWLWRRRWMAQTARWDGRVQCKWRPRWQTGEPQRSWAASIRWRPMPRHWNTPMNACQDYRLITERTSRLQTHYWTHVKTKTTDSLLNARQDYRLITERTPRLQTHYWTHVKTKTTDSLLNARQDYRLITERTPRLQTHYWLCIKYYRYHYKCSGVANSNGFQLIKISPKRDWRSTPT